MLRNAALAVLFLVTLNLYPAVANPSFNCQNASNPTENTICASPSLSRLDVSLANKYSNYRSILSGNLRENLISQQRGWVQERNACGNRVSCIQRRYEDRLAELSFNLFAHGVNGRYNVVVGGQRRNYNINVYPSLRGSSRGADFCTIIFEVSLDNASGGVGFDFFNVRGEGEIGPVKLYAKRSVFDFGMVDSVVIDNASGEPFFRFGSLFKENITGYSGDSAFRDVPLPRRAFDISMSYLWECGRLN